MTEPGKTKANPHRELMLVQNYFTIFIIGFADDSPPFTEAEGGTKAKLGVGGRFEFVCF